MQMTMVRQIPKLLYIFTQNGQWPLTVREDLKEALTKLMNYARSRTASPADAEDLVSRTIVKVLEREDELEQKGVNVEAYAITTMRNLSIDDHRARKRHKTDIGLDENKGTSDPNANQMGWSAQGGSNPGAESLAAINEIYRLILQLPEYCRDVLVMLGLEQTYAEIAESLGIDSSTVGTRALRCRKQLKELMDGAAA